MAAEEKEMRVRLLTTEGRSMTDDLDNWTRLRGIMHRGRRKSIDVEKPTQDQAIPDQRNALRDDYEEVDAWEWEHPVL